MSARSGAAIADTSSPAQPGGAADPEGDPEAGGMPEARRISRDAREAAAMARQERPRDAAGAAQTESAQISTELEA